MSRRGETAARLETVWSSIREATARHEREQREATIIPKVQPRKVRKVRKASTRRESYSSVLRAYAAKLDREATRAEGYEPGYHGPQYTDTSVERRQCKCCKRDFPYVGHAYCPSCLHWTLDPESAARH